MKPRSGVALATALMLMALILVIGLALATSSMMSLNLSRQSYLNTRCDLVARSAVNELIARLARAESTREVQLFNPQPLDLNLTFPGRSELVPGCWITFDRRQQGYSTDNSLSDTRAAGWLDRGSSQTSVPPYTLELILNTEQGATRRSFRALVRRTWPYAVYSGGGPVVLSGNPHQSDGGSRVNGRIHAAVRPVNLTQEGRDPVRRHPRAVLFNMFTGYRPQRDYGTPLQLGPPVDILLESFRLEGEPPPGRPEREPARYRVEALRGDFVTLPDRGNVLTGSVDYTDDERRQNLTVQVNPGNRWQGQIHYKSPGLLRDPLQDLTPGDTQGYQPWTPPARMFRVAQKVYNVVAWPPEYPGSVFREYADRPTYVIWNTQRLVGAQDRPNYYVVDGNLVNRVLAWGATTLPEELSELGEPIPVAEYGFGLELQDCVLHVKGDLDLCDLTGHDPAIKGITGNGATLIVEGSLSLTGAQLRAGDRGMVIFAKNIALAGAGDFSGLLVASQSISIIPQEGKQVRIRGGLVTASSSAGVTGTPGIVLSNVHVDYDPRYLKSLNSFGDYRLTAWEPL